MQLWRMASLALCVTAALSGYSQAQQVKNTSTQTTPIAQTPPAEKPQEADVPYVPTPEEVVAEMLNVAKVNKNDLLYDLGSGDGRIVITAAQKFGARGVGVEINPQLIQESQENARKAGVSDRVKFINQDLFQIDLREATVVTLYLLPRINLQLRPKLLSELKPGTRLVSHSFDMKEWKPDRVLQVPDQRFGDSRVVYYWVIPAQVEGAWQGTLATSEGSQLPFTIQLKQRFQRVSGTVQAKGQQVSLDDLKLMGNQLVFDSEQQVQGQKVRVQFSGNFNGDNLEGTVVLQGGSYTGTYKVVAKRA